jgi:hypothetical protein
MGARSRRRAIGTSVGLLLSTSMVPVQPVLAAFTCFEVHVICALDSGSAGRVVRRFRVIRVGSEEIGPQRRSWASNPSKRIAVCIGPSRL